MKKAILIGLLIGTILLVGCNKEIEDTSVYCQEENPDWILANCANLVDEDGWILYDLPKGCRSDSEPICRKKTIYDYNCEELKKAILFGSGGNWAYCQSKNCFSWDCGVCWKDSISRIQIYNIAIKKGCKI